jgi:hypothetical protein
MTDRDASEAPWETLDTFFSLPEAYGARAALDAHGFETRLLDDLSSMSIGGGPLSVMGVRLQVRRDRKWEARTLLVQLIAENTREDEP